MNRLHGTVNTPDEKRARESAKKEAEKYFGTPRVIVELKDATPIKEETYAGEVIVGFSTEYLAWAY